MAYFLNFGLSIGKASLARAFLLNVSQDWRIGAEKIVTG
jgi:hypothetical protein